MNEHNTALRTNATALLAAQERVRAQQTGGKMRAGGGSEQGDGGDGLIVAQLRAQNTALHASLQVENARVQELEAELERAASASAASAAPAASAALQHKHPLTSTISLAAAAAADAAGSALDADADAASELELSAEELREASLRVGVMGHKGEANELQLQQRFAACLQWGRDAAQLLHGASAASRGGKEQQQQQEQDEPPVSRPELLAAAQRLLRGRRERALQALRVQVSRGG